MRIFSYILLILTTAIGSPYFMSAQKSGFSEVISRFASDKDFKGASIGVAMIDLESGRIVGAHQPETILIPASVLKLFTTAAAYDILGPQFKFKTELFYTGKIEGGRLKGDIIVKGSGDPTLGSVFNNNSNINQVMKECLKMLKEKGINGIEGNIIADASFFGTTSAPAYWNYGDIGNYYGGGAWGLNITDNEYQLTFKQVGQLNEVPSIVKIEPSIPGMVLRNELRSGPANSGDNAYIFGAPSQLERTVRGTIPVGNGLFSIRGSMPDPPHFFAQAMFDYLNSNSLEVVGGPQTDREAVTLDWSDATLLGSLMSPPLPDIAAVINKRSNNLYAESIFKTIQQSRGQISEPGSSSVMSKWFNDFTKEDQKVFLYDGSGLSRANGVSALQTALILFQVSGKPYFKSYFESLATPGEAGTFSNAFRAMPAGTSFRGKSGSMNRVRSYAGYLQHLNGKKYAIAIICNNFDLSSAAVRQKFEKLIYDLAVEKL